MRKLAFVNAAMDRDDPFEAKVAIPADVKAALEWTAARSAEEVILERESVISEFERLGKAAKESGDCEKWLESCDASMREVVKSINGPLLQQLMKAVEHCDQECADLFRKGAPLLGKLFRSGIGEAVESVEV